MKTIECRDLLTAEQTGGRLTRTELWVGPGQGMWADSAQPRHEQRFEVVRGRMVLEREGRRHVLLAGERGRVPPGVPYAWCNGGEGELHVIVEEALIAPAGV